MFRRSGPPAAVALVLLVSLFWPATGGTEGVRECGRPGAPPCPMQRWMREEVAGPLQLRRWEELADRLERLAKHNPQPKSWSRWTRFSLEGARGARDENRGAVLSACRGCHSRYRRPYKQHHRRAAPP